MSIDREMCKAIGSHQDPRPWHREMVAWLAGIYDAKPHLPPSTEEP